MAAFSTVNAWDYRDDEQTGILAIKLFIDSIVRRPKLIDIWLVNRGARQSNG